MTPRPLSFVKVLSLPDESTQPFGDGPLLFLGEIPNMPGHCIVVEVRSGKFHAGWHTERFVELSADEM